MAITTARRLGELGALSFMHPYCKIFQDKIVLKPLLSFTPKTNSRCHRDQKLILPEFYSCPSSEEERKLQNLDLRRDLIVYLERVAPFRLTECLFINFGAAKKGEQPSTLL